MEKKFNILFVTINGTMKEQVTIGKRDPKRMGEGFKTAYELTSGYGNWEIFFYAQSSMNTNGRTKVS